MTTYVVHPGAIRTGLQDGTVMGVFFDIAYYASYPLWKDIPHGAATTICCAVDENLANESGKYYRLMFELVSKSFTAQPFETCLPISAAQTQEKMTNRIAF